MNTSKNLEWFKQNDDFEGFYAEPYGLRCRYSIIKHGDKKIEFAVLDHNYEYTAGFPKFCQSFEIAKDKAAKHYSFLLTQISEL